MNPFEAARHVYDNEPCRRSFAEDLELHLRNGFVFATPAYFIMGRPVKHTAPPEQVIDPSVVFPVHLCDCWHVWLMAGDVSKAWDILPWPLPLISFERKNELRFQKAADIRRLSLGHASPT